MAGEPRRRHAPAARRLGYAVAALVNAILWYLVNEWPGWEAVPFLTGEMTQVLGLLNLSLLVGAAVNVAFIVYDARWFRAACDVLTSGIGLALAIRVAQVFPFDFSDYAFDWSTLVRILVILGIVGSGVAVISALVRFAREVYQAAGGR